MMIVRRTLLKSAAALVALLLTNPVWAASDGPLKVVATFSILGDMVTRIGGAHVSVTTLVGPNGDTHVYQPVPADARAVSEANILLVNGLGFEGWLDRLVEASGFTGIRVVATAGIKPLALDQDDHHEEKGAEKHDDHDGDHDHHDHGAFDPHAWHSLANGVIYVDNITAALSKADPTNASFYYQNRAAYVAEMMALDDEVRRSVDALPKDARTIVTAHDAFGYFSQTYGLNFVAPQGISTESEASAADVAALIRQIRAEKIKAVFVETVSDSRLIEQISNETGAVIGGTLYSDALSGADGPASTYLKMMRHNMRTLTTALSS